MRLTIHFLTSIEIKEVRVSEVISPFCSKENQNLVFVHESNIINNINQTNKSI